jgi:CHASE2 domain-containing sensor protein
VGLILGWVAYAKNSPGFALASAILYTLGSLTLIYYFFLGLISTVLAYVAYAFMLKARKKAQINTADPLP